MRTVSQILCALLLGLCACKHDIDALKAERGTAGTTGGSGGRAGSGGSSGTGGSSGADAGDAGGTGGSGGSGGMCGPCDMPDARDGGVDGGLDGGLTLEACCRGPRECGLKFPNRDLCLPRDAEGKKDSACPSSEGPGGGTLEGCCRTDARCGIYAEESGLGCVARDQVNETEEPIFCDYECDADTDCGPEAASLVCAEQSDESRKCVVECTADRDCFGPQGCALSNDLRDNRVIAVCKASLPTAVEPGEVCNDTQVLCRSRICIKDAPGAAQGTCSEFCTKDDDCSGGLPNCEVQTISGPLDPGDGGMRPVFQFRVCSK